MRRAIHRRCWFLLLLGGLAVLTPITLFLVKVMFLARHDAGLFVLGFMGLLTAVMLRFITWCGRHLVRVARGASDVVIELRHGPVNPAERRQLLGTFLPLK